MPRKKEIDAAWKVHDEHRGEGFDCKKQPGWNNLMGHSHFNQGCQEAVIEYAKAHPIPRQRTTVEKPAMAKCAKCHKKRSIPKLVHRPKRDQSKAKNDEILMEYICQKCLTREAKREKAEARKQAKALLKMQQDEKRFKEECSSFGNFNLDDAKCRDCDKERKLLCMMNTPKEANPS